MPSSYVLSLPSQIMKVRQIIDQRFCGCISIYASLSVACKVRPCIKDIRTEEWRFYLGTSSTYLCVEWAVSVFSSTRQTYWEFLECKLLSRQQPLLFGYFHGTPLENISAECKTIQILELHFCDKRWPIVTLSPSLFVDFNNKMLKYFGKFQLH